MRKILNANPGMHAASRRLTIDRRAMAHRSGRCRRERGVVLVITLILVVILSLLGTFAIRNATQTERSINGIRSAEVAREAAETALRFCEQVAIFDGDGKDYTEYGATDARGRIVATTIGSEVDTTAAWRTEANWMDSSANVIEVPIAYFKKDIGSNTAASQLRIRPRCLIQRIDSTSTPKLTGYLITARGFANNANFSGTTGKSTQGAESWMQSVLTRGS